MIVNEERLKKFEDRQGFGLTAQDGRDLIETTRKLREALEIAWECAYSLSARQKEFILKVLEDTK